jgi:PhnB protein
MALCPYLSLPNTAKAAMTRYQEILGGELEILTAADLPPGEEMPFEAPGDFVINAALTFGDGDLLMASDDPEAEATVKGASLNITLADQDEARRIFEALAEDGTIDMALGETFWSPLFGTCVDRFGVSWMVNVDPDAAA